MKPHEIITVEKEENVLLLKTMCLYKLFKKKKKPFKIQDEMTNDTIEAKHISKQNNKRLRLKNFFNLLLCLCCFSSHGCRRLPR